MSDISQFSLTIDVGNDSMETAYDVAAALRSVASKLELIGSFEAGEVHTLRDLNGNTVGTWEATS